jgi:hypothetical protein
MGSTHSTTRRDVSQYMDASVCSTVRGHLSVHLSVRLHAQRGSEPTVRTCIRSEPTVIDRVEAEHGRATRRLVMGQPAAVGAAAAQPVEGQEQARLGLRRHLLLRSGALAQRLGRDRDAPDERGRCPRMSSARTHKLKPAVIKLTDPVECCPPRSPTPRRCTMCAA